jgi:tetratricopeptide (TPR) repeat protein
VDFWQHDNLRDALNSRHFGRIVQAYRLAHRPPLSQTLVAGWLRLTQAQISRMERADVPPSDLRKLQDWATTLKIPSAMLWFAAGHLTDASEVSEQYKVVDNLDEVRRRELIKLTGATVLSGSSLIIDTPWSRLTESLAGRRSADESVVHAITRRTEHHVRVEDTQPARERVPALQRHERAIRDVLTMTSEDSLRRRLLTCLGQTQALTGLAMFDTQRHHQAVALYRQALEAAREAGDGPLIAYTLCLWTYLLGSRGDHAGAAQMLIQASENVRGSSAATHSWISGHLAERQAAAGESHEALRSLDKALALFDYVGTDSDRPWRYFITAGRMGGFAVGTHVRLQHKNTEQIADGLLASLPTEEGKNRALIQSELAVSAAYASDYEQMEFFAIPAAQFALNTDFTQVIDRLWDLVETLPTTSATGRRVRSELTEQLLDSTSA